MSLFLHKSLNEIKRVCARKVDLADRLRGREKPQNPTMRPMTPINKPKNPVEPSQLNSEATQ